VDTGGFRMFESIAHPGHPLISMDIHRWWKPLSTNIALWKTLSTNIAVWMYYYNYVSMRNMKVN
jgi:hypothetical protein